MRIRRSGRTGELDRHPSADPTRLRPSAVALFVGPALLVYGMFILYPVVAGALVGLTSWRGLSMDLSWVGLDNYAAVVSDPALRGAALRTIVFALQVVIVQNVVGLALALALKRAFRGVGVFRSLFFGPIVLSAAVVAYLWRALYNPATGPLGLLGQLGIDGAAGFNPLANADTALSSVVVVLVWQFAGLNMLIYIAALNSIPEGLYEASAVDGASAVQQFRRITLPLLVPAIAVNVLLVTISSLRHFDHLFLLTGGGPGTASEIVGTAIYRLSFERGLFGYGAALSTILLLVILVVATVQSAWFQQRERALQ